MKLITRYTALEFLISRVQTTLHTTGILVFSSSSLNKTHPFSFLLSLSLASVIPFFFLTFVLSFHLHIFSLLLFTVIVTVKPSFRHPFFLFTYYTSFSLSSCPLTSLFPIQQSYSLSETGRPFSPSIQLCLPFISSVIFYLPCAVK